MKIICKSSIFAILAAAVISCEKINNGTGESQGGNNTGITGTYSSLKAGNEWDGTKRADITYQLLVYSFADSDGDGIGDFKGIVDKLDYLDELGVSAIWLSPIHPSMSYHGYDVLDYAGINPAFGTEDDFRNLIEKAHEKDIRIYIDYVLNHTGRDHPWFQDAASSEDSPYRDWYIFSSNPADDIKNGKIAMIAKEGAGGYDGGQWFQTTTGAEDRLRFDLDWSNASAPKITVTKTEDALSGAGSGSEKYLYFGDGECIEFIADGGERYHLVVDFASSWGFLVRTSNSSSWPVGTKYGANGSESLAYGVPYTLFTSSKSNDEVGNLLLPDMSVTYYHSHFWTDWFADLNYGPASDCENSGAFKAVVEAGRKWIDMGIDGMRLDAVKHIYHSQSSDENPTFLKKFYDEMNSAFHKNRSDDFYMVGEMYDSYVNAAPYYKGIPGLFDFSSWYSLRDAINGGNGIGLLPSYLERQAKFASYRQDYIDATKLTNHDENRAASELSNDISKIKLAGAVLLSAGGSPYIYYGEELGYTGRKDSGDEYVRQPMLWGDLYTTSYTDKIDPGFKSTADVLKQKENSNSVYNVYKAFASARNSHPALACGTMSEHRTLNSSNKACPEALACWYMSSSEEKALVLHNMGGAQIEFFVPDSVTEVAAVLGNVQARTESAGGIRVKMDRLSSVVFIVK